MKTFKYLYSQMLDENIIRKAWKKLRKGKTKRTEVQQIDDDFDNAVARMREMLKNTKPEGVYVEHPELAFNPKPKKPKIIKENGKNRIIYMPSIVEQWVHHIIVLVLEPILSRSAYPHSCGSVPKKGAHYGKKRVEKWLKDAKNTRNVLKVDIRHFYNKIRLDILIWKLAKIIRDVWFMFVLILCFKGFKKGIPLGFYLSQWLANFFLKDLDYYIKHTLKIPYYMRYMDDMVLFAANKKVLHKALIAIKIELGKIRLKLKSNYQVFKFYYVNKKGKVIGRKLDFMGFLFTRENTTMRKRIMLSTTRLARKIFKHDKIYVKHARAMLSAMGWFSCTDTYDCYLTHIKPFVSIKRLKRIVSLQDRRNRRHDCMENGKMLTAAA